MIIEKNALYQSLQSAFSTHHKRFPWPKRHDLEDQTEQFQAAFDQFTVEVNEAVRNEIISHKEIERDHYCDKVRSLQSELSEARWWNVFYLFTIGICVGAFVIGYIVGSIVLA